MSDPVLYELRDGMALITLNQPERRNVMSFELMDALSAALDRAAGEDTARLALLRANGTAFCAGMDLKTVALDDPEQAKRYATGLAGLYRRLIMLPIPLLCGVDGPALGGAVGVAMAADLVWMGPEARFHFPETRVGVVPAFVSVIARRRMTPGKLAGMAITGFTADASTAVRLGMAEFASSRSAGDDAEGYARRLKRENSREAMRRTKAFLQKQFDGGLDAALDAAREEFCVAVASDAARQGLEMFRQKKPLVWD